MNFSCQELHGWRQVGQGDGGKVGTVKKSSILLIIVRSYKTVSIGYPLSSLRPIRAKTKEINTVLVSVS
jgi:hypothetical protein